MGRKRGESEPLWEGEQPWAPGQTVRAITGGGISTGEQTALVMLEVRSMPGLRFDLELDVRHQVVAVAVRPLVRVAVDEAVGIVRPTGGVRGGRALWPMPVDDVPPDAKPLTSRQLRDVPWGALAAEAERKVRFLGHVVGPLAGGSWAETLSVAPVKPGRRSKRDDLFFASLAADYVRLIETGTDEERRRAAETLGQAPSRCYSASTISNLLREARRRKLLTAAPSKGRAGGQLTDKARALLAIELEKGA